MSEVVAFYKMRFCNSMLGMARDSRELLHKAAAYLENRGSYHNIAAARSGRKG